MNCPNCNKRLPLIIGRKDRIKAVLYHKELGQTECEFCSKECALEYSTKWKAEIIS